MVVPASAAPGDYAAVGPGPAQALLPLGAAAGIEQSLQLDGAQFFGRLLSSHGGIIAQELSLIHI